MWNIKLGLNIYPDHETDLDRILSVQLNKPCIFFLQDIKYDSYFDIDLSFFFGLDLEIDFCHSTDIS